MKLLRLGAASLNQTPLDWDGNRQRIEAAIDDARDAGVALLCLPELAITGYGCEDMYFSAGVHQAAVRSLMELVPATTGIAVAVGMPLFYESALYNCAALIADGELLGIVGKQFLASDGIHYEPRWFRRWPAGVVGEIEIDGVDYPVGDLLFDVGGVRIGFEICRDAWVADRPGGALARRGADIILNPSASHFAFAKQSIRERFVLEGSRAFCVSYVYCNLLGNESGRAVYDGGTLIATGGQMIAAGRRFSYHDAELTSAVIDIDAMRRTRAQSFDHGPPDDDDGQLLEYDYAWPAASAAAPSPPLSESRSQLEPWELPAPSKQEEFARAVPLALFDYLRRSRTGGFVLSLSGGADSSAVATLVHLMARLAIADLGANGFAERLSHLPKLAAIAEKTSATDSIAGTASEMVHQLLTCVYQSTRNSTDTTRNAAETVAKAVGSQFLEWSVDELVEGYKSVVSAAMGRDLTWETDDLALQNIQARARGPAAWLVANLRGALLLATSNRSEAAVGYATMDGDTCGGLSPIAGIDKAFLREWLVWMETTGPNGVGPLAELSVVNAQQPTAELRPQSAEQTDEGDLMPYQVLDAIERAAIRDKRLPAEVFSMVRDSFEEYSHKQMGEWVIRFFRLWCRNQWKRERYAPSFHVDDENLDPKTWCRFPILSSGFEEELAELRVVVDRL